MTTAPELLAALSLATDLGSDVPPEHALHTCVIAGRLAEAAGASRDERDATYEVALLRDIGCTAGGDVAARSEVARRLAERLRRAPLVQDSLLHAFDRWDVAGEAMPVPARLVSVALARGAPAHDPAIAGLLTAEMLEPPAEGAWEAVMAAAPDRRRLSGAALDEACAAVGDFADLKSPWTLGHSPGVADLAEAAAWRRGLPFEEIDAVRRAALLHDLGRVGVPSAVWDRRGPLSEADHERVRLHPHLTEHTLARAGGLAVLGRIGGAHHERLDGSGYHRGRTGADLGAAERLIAAADVFHAMTEERPHRPAHTADAAAAELTAQARAGRLDAHAVDAVLGAVAEARDEPRRKPPNGLTEREAHLLGVVARGGPADAGELQAAYAKISVTTRAAAALFAAENGLLP